MLCLACFVTVVFRIHRAQIPRTRALTRAHVQTILYTKGRARTGSFFIEWGGCNPKRRRPAPRGGVRVNLNPKSAASAAEPPPPPPCGGAWPLQDIAIANIVLCMAHKGGVRGASCIAQKSCNSIVIVWAVQVCGGVTG